MVETKANAPLLETLARRMDCAYLSDLKYLDRRRRKVLAELLRKTAASRASCAEWNDALAYLGGEGACANAESARRALLELLEDSA